MTLSLDQLREDIDKKFVGLDLEVGGETLVLQNLMRLNEKPRRAVMDALPKMNGLQDKDEDDFTQEDLDTLVEVMNVVLRNIVKDGKGDALIAALDGDLQLTMSVFEAWTEATQPGEAESSPS